MTPPLADLLSDTVERRFWSKVDKRGPDECWEWGAARSPRGYGSIRINNETVKTHRLSFVLAFGWEPPATLHKCDNPPCVNPRHLFGGTQADNMADCTKKWRAPSQITPALKSTIFALRESGMTQTAIARQLGLTIATVSRTLRGVCNPGPFDGDDHFQLSVRQYNPLPDALREERARICFVPCPECGSPSGSKCRTRGGFILSPPHVVRRLAAASP